MPFNTEALLKQLNKGVKIPLFDIDWTLLKGNPINKIPHSKAFDHAIETIYHQKTTYSDLLEQGFVAEGMIDTQVILETLKANGLSEQQGKEKIEQAINAMTGYFKQHAGEGQYEPMNGVVDLLEELKQKNLPLGLLTGNVEEIGWDKLERGGLKSYFSFGAFGNLAFKRVDLIEVARKRAEAALGIEVPLHSLIIVGDSPLDIACARAGGIQVIAVGAGHFKSQHLQEADLVIDSLEEKEKILDFLNIT